MQAMIFDLDGTLIDTVYAHVFAWQQALAELDMAIDGWKIPGAVELLALLTRHGIPHGIATSGRRPDINASLEALGVLPSVPVVGRTDVRRAKPEPDLFLACAERLGADPGDCYVVGDAVWDILAARRARMLSVGVLTGGYAEEELTRAGAFRVYRDVRAAARLKGPMVAARLAASLPGWRSLSNRR